MFEKALRRLTLGALLVVSVAALAAATGGSAGVGFVQTSTFSSVDPQGVDCHSFSVQERHYCLVVKTYNNLKQSGGIEVDQILQNRDSGTLTNPSTTLSWDNTNAHLTFASSDPAICSSPSPGIVTCNGWANIPGVGSAAGTGASNDSTVKIYFTSAATATSVTFSATATAKENGNDNPGASNVETQSVSGALMTFGDGGATSNGDATVLLPTPPYNNGHLHSSLGNASVDFSSLSSPAFIAQFAVSSGVPCVLNVSCAGLDLNTDLSGAAGGTFSAGNQILWTADVPANNTNILAVHTYDPVSITPSAPNKLTAAGTKFANCDGVVFTDFKTNPQANLQLGQTYFVRNATTSGGNTSFQVSATAKGSLINVTAGSSISGSCVRIIGDKPASEVTKACTLTSAPAMPATPPVLCAVKKDNSTVRAYLWDDANGHLGY